MGNLTDLYAKYDQIMAILKQDLINNQASPLRIALLYQAKRELGLGAGFVEASEI